MLYIILILLLYWVSYKVLKHYSWNVFVFNKQSNFLLSFLKNKRLIRVQSYRIYNNFSITKINKQNYNEA